MILSTEQIESLCIGKMPPLIEPYNPDDNIGNPAKVELHLGKHCYCSDKPNKIFDLKDGDTVTIKPNTIFLFETLERFNFPDNLSGRMSLKMGLVSQGLLMPNQTQIDPGYSNVIFGMIYNLSSQEIELSYKQSISTLEVYVTKKSSNHYSGRMKKISFGEFVSTRIHSSLGKLESDVKSSQQKLNTSVKIWNVFLTSISVVIAALTIFVGVSSFRASFKDDADIVRLEQKVEDLTEELKECQDKINELEDALNNSKNDETEVSP